MGSTAKEGQKMSLKLIAMFMDSAGRHAKAAKHHGNKQVREAERILAITAIDNALNCRDLSRATRLEILRIRGAMMFELWGIRA
jgi:hypothetical protein